MHSGAKCPVCGKFYFSNSAKDVVCGECLKSAPSFDFHRSAGLYEGTLREAILLYKYGKIEYLAKPIAEFAVNNVKNIWSVDCIVPIPSHKKRIKERGFDHTLKLAREIGKIKNLRVRKILKKVKHTPPQTGLSRSSRISNPKGSFLAKKIEDCDKILLLDDVWTTGSTIKEASRTLTKIGYSVIAITVARDI